MSFGDQVTAATDQYRKRLRYVMRESVQRVAETAQRQRGEGGRMRVDTGFLRASIQAAIGQIPSGPTRGSRGDSYSSQITGMSPAAALLRWQPGKALYIGWTAGYARAREARDGFFRGAVEQWPRYVDQAVAQAKRRKL